MSEPLDLEDLRRRSFRWRTTTYDTERCINEIDQLRAEVKRLRAALHGSEAGPQEAREWTGQMSGFAPAETDRSTTNSGDVGGPTMEKP